MIPNILWQTYKTKKLPKDALFNLKSWVTKNPGLSWHYMDDVEVKKFFEETFSDEYVSMFNELPVPVMKADLWRIAIIYVYGGFYADLDVECVRPMKEWTKDNNTLVVGIETDGGNLGNYMFGATPKHPALLRVLESMFEFHKNNQYENSPTPVQDYAQNIFDSVVRKWIEENKSDNTVVVLPRDYYNENETVSKAICHHVASLHWSGYESWRDGQRDVFGKVDPHRGY